MRVKRYRTIRAQDDDDYDEWSWLERGDCYELPSDPRPKLRSVSTAAHIAFETARSARGRRPIGFHLPKHHRRAV